MQKYKSIAICLIIIMIFSSIAAADSDSITIINSNINVDNSTKSVNIVAVDMNNPLIDLEVAISNDKVGGDEDFKDIIKRTNADAAINANFFESYTNLEPIGTIIKNGNIIYMEGTNTSMAVQNDGKICFDRFTSVLRGFLDGKQQNEWNNNTQSMDYYLFDVWYINRLPSDPTGVYLYTPDRGTSLEVEGGIAVEVVQNKVSRVVKQIQQISIPYNGYVIYYGSQAADESFVDARFKPGRTVSLELESFQPSTDTDDNNQQADASTLTAESVTLYGCVDKTTNNYWDTAKNGMDFNIFTVWYINTNPIDSSGVYLYTPEKGASLDVPQGTAVLVSEGRVESILYNTDSFKIPQNGYVLYFGKSSVDDNYIKQRFEIGKTVDFYHSDTLKIDTDNLIEDAVSKNQAALYIDNTKAPTAANIDAARVDNLISAGPYLVKAGKIIVNPKGDGFTSEKITTNRAQRSAIGITADNQLFMITVANTNMTELANIMLQLGAVEAMNLDGGASSALYAKGQTITAPGRRLSTVLLVYDYSNDKQPKEKVYSFIENKIKNMGFTNLDNIKRAEAKLTEYVLYKFHDIKSTDWFTKNITYLAAMNIINGYDDNTVKPQNTVNADAFIKMTIMSLGYNLKNGSDYWASTYIDKAKELGLVKDSEFDVYNRPITRGEMARIIARALNEQTKEDLTDIKNKIADINDISIDFQTSIIKVYGLGIMTGYDDNTFRAEKTVSRAEAATAILRMVDKSVRK